MKTAEKRSASTNNGESSERHPPTKSLPSSRTVSEKQFEVIRACSIKSGTERRAIKLPEIAEVVDLAPGTVGLILPFFVEIGLLAKLPEGGYTPSVEVFNFERAHNFNPETARQKLAEPFRKSWVGESLLPTLRMRPLKEDEAIENLAEAVSASSHYRPALAMALALMQEVGLIVNEEKIVRATPLAAGDVAPTNPPPSPANQDPKVAENKITPLNGSITGMPGAGIIALDVSIRIDMAELAKLPADRITAVFSGIAQVVAVKKELTGS